MSVGGLWVNVRPARGDWLNDNRRMAKSQWASTAHFLPQTRESEQPNTPDQSSNADMTGAGVRAGPARPLVEAQGAKVALAACYRGCRAWLKHLRLPPRPSVKLWHCNPVDNTTHSLTAARWAPGNLVGPTAAGQP